MIATVSLRLERDKPARTYTQKLLSEWKAVTLADTIARVALPHFWGGPTRWRSVDLYRRARRRHFGHVLDAMSPLDTFATDHTCNCRHDVMGRIKACPDIIPLRHAPTWAL